MTSWPTVSVLMPAYNAERYVAEAVESILNQTFRDFEFLIVDDGSTDRTKSILETYALDDERIRLTSRPNTGLVVALNEMLDKAQAPYIARMDADDIALPNRIERQVAYMRSHPDCAVVSGRALVIDPDGDPLCEWFSEQIHEEIDRAHINSLQGSCLCHPAAMIRAESVRMVGGYRRDAWPAEDLDLWLRLAEIGRLAILPDLVLKYRNYPSSISNSNWDRRLRALEHVVAEARQRRGIPPLSNTGPGKLRSNGVTNPHARWGWWALKSGYLDSARKHARLNLRHRPWSSNSWRLFYCALRGR